MEFAENVAVQQQSAARGGVSVSSAVLMLKEVRDQQDVLRDVLATLQEKLGPVLSGEAAQKIQAVPKRDVSSESPLVQQGNDLLDSVIGMKEMVEELIVRVQL